MARTSKSQKTSNKPKGPTSESKAKKTKSMDELLGVAAMEVETMVRTEAEDLRELKQSQQTHRLFSEWLSFVHSIVEDGRNSGGKQISWADRSCGVVNPVPILQFSDDDEVKSQSHNSKHGNTVDMVVRNIVKIDMEDIQPEVDYWSSSVICYVVGANPPPMVMEGYVRRIWRNNGIDKVAMLKKGVFIVRFATMEQRDKILAGYWISLIVNQLL